MENKKIIKLNQAARLNSVPYQWLKRQAEQGKFPSVKAGNVYLVKPEIVEDFLVQLAGAGHHE